MRVPVRRQPETRISEQQQGYARAVAPLNVEPVTRLIEGFRDQLLDEQDARQRIELNQRLVREVNELQVDFATRQRNPELSLTDFTEGLNADYTDRHAALLTELRKSGYSQDLLNDFDTRLGTVRQGFFERGLAHQLVQLGSRAEESLEDGSRQSSQYAATDPVNNYATARDDFVNSVRTHPDLTEDQRAALEDQGSAVIRDAASRALAIQNPQLIINLLDPQGLTAPHQTTLPSATGTVPSTATPTVAREDFKARVRQSESGGNDRIENPMPGATASGRYQFIRSTWVGMHRQLVGGNMTDEQRWAQRFDVNLQERFMDVAVDGYERALGEAGQPITAGNLYLSHFFGPETAVRILQNPTTPLATILGRRADITFRQNPNLRRNMTGADVIALTTRAMGGATQATAVAEEAPAFRPAPSFVPQAGEQTASAAPIPGQPSVQSDGTIAAEPTDINSIRTGNALLDDLNGSERLQLLGRAREQQARVLATQRAEMDVRIGNITAEALNNGGEIAAPIPTEQEVLQTYGPVEGPQRWAQITQSQATGRAIVQFRTQSAQNIQAALDRLEPQAGSPTYQTQLQIYQAAERAAQTLLTQRQQDPAAYAMQHFPAVRQAAQRGTAQYYAALDRVYQTLGIDTRTAPVMTSEAAQQMNLNYRAMGAQQRGQFIEQNMEEMGEARFRRFVLGMEGTTAATDARIYALLRSYPGANQTRTLFNQILEGREIIAQDPAKRPRESEVREVFRAVGLNAIRDLNAETSRSIQEAAEALYAQRGGDPVNINRTLYREALTAVLGGNLPADMRRGAVPDYTILPPRVNERQFRNWMERQTISTLTQFGTERQAPRWGDLRTPVPIERIIDEGVFVMVSPGYYGIRMASDGRPLMTPNGNRYIMRIDARGIINPGPVRQPQSQVRPSVMRGGRM